MMRAMPNVSNDPVRVIGKGDIDRQIRKMLAVNMDRKVREDSDNVPWNTYAGALIFGYGKFTRLIKTSDNGISINTSICPERIAEECRDIAHYLLRGAAMLYEGANR